MTAICGLVCGAPGPQRERTCAEALTSLAPYYETSQSLIQSIDGASFAAGWQSAPVQPGPQPPLVNSDGIIVAADIRIDNCAEFARLLGVGGDAISDVELLHRAWRRWGEECLATLIGDYAIAVYSSVERKLWLARSLGGNRPLFYSRPANGVAAFASMWNGLRLGPERIPLDLKWLALGLADVPSEPERCGLAGIWRVKPNEIVTIDGSGVRSRLIWTPHFGPLHFKDRRDYVEAYRAVLDEAVKCRLNPGGITATYLSAGYDSNAVTTSAARLGVPEKLIAITAAPCADWDPSTLSGRIGDESALASLTAKTYELEHIIVRSSEPALAHLRKEARLFQEPFRNVLNAGWDLAVRKAAQRMGSSVMLTGELGNLTLNAGGPYVLADMIGRGEWLAWLREFRAARQPLGLSTLLGNSFYRWLPESLASSLRRRRHKLPPPWQLSFLNEEWVRVAEKCWASRGGSTGDTSRQRWSMIGGFDPGCIRKGALAQTGTDVRDPLCDRRVVQFSLSLPPRQLFSGGLESPLARRALAGRVPAQLLKQRIRGVQSADWHQKLKPRDVLDMIDEIESSQTVRELIDIAKLRAAVREWPQEDPTANMLISRYTHMLPRTLSAGLFIRDFE